MSTRDSRERLSEIETPVPPVALTAYELLTIIRFVEYQQRRAARKARKNQEEGRTFSGLDADAVRAENFMVLLEKLDDWMDAAVADAPEDHDLLVVQDIEEPDEAEGGWLSRSRFAALARAVR